jgi:hypothetical protein
MLQPMCEVIQKLLQGGLTGAEPLRTFSSCRVQLLHLQEVTMWMYPGPSCPNRPFSVELGTTEMNTQIRGVLSHGSDLNLGSGPVPLREGVKSPCVSLLGLAFGHLCQSLFLNVRLFLCKLSGVLTVPCKGSPYLRMWQGGRETVSTMNGCGHGGK